MFSSITRRTLYYFLCNDWQLESLAALYNTTVNDDLLDNTCLQLKFEIVHSKYPLVLIFIGTLNWFDVATQVQSASSQKSPRCYFKVFIIVTGKSCSLKFHIPFSLGWNSSCKRAVAVKESNPASDHRGGTKSVLIIKNMVSIEDVNCSDGCVCGELPGISCRDNKNEFLNKGILK